MRAGLPVVTRACAANAGSSLGSVGRTTERKLRHWAALQAGSESSRRSHVEPPEPVHERVRVGPLLGDAIGEDDRSHDLGHSLVES